MVFVGSGRSCAFHYRILILTILQVVIAVASPTAGHASRLTTLHAFCAKPNCADGKFPSSLIEDAVGNFYGVTGNGGTSIGGVVFELTRDQNTGRWKQKVLHSFCRKGGYGCTDGSAPSGRLVLDVNGNLYGVANAGGISDTAGLVFELIPNADHSKWQYEILYKFCRPGCEDGFSPRSGLTYQGQATGVPYDGISPLYGATVLGGVNEEGVAFQLTPVAGKWREKVIYSFCAQPNCSDGGEPTGGMIIDRSGNLFGTTSYPVEVVFELSHAGKREWTETVLYTFCQGQNCADGNGPNLLVMGAQGNLFGTTFLGGANGRGTIFSVVPNGVNSQYSVRYSFCSLADCADGSGPPLSDLLVDQSGTLYGVTEFGGGHDIDISDAGGGTVFSLTSGGKFKVLYAFCAKTVCADGEYPTGGLVIGSSGDLFGTTTLGGKNAPDPYDGGTAFELTP
jgi:uncharacterized repeat protein (TIGR03803 family)